MSLQQGFLTNHSLLARLRIRPVDSAAWRDFNRRYGPLIGLWCQRRGLGDADAQDVTQDVLARLVSALRTFVYDPRGGFRRWLFAVCRNAIHDFRRHERQPARGTGDSGVARLLNEVPAPQDSRRVLAEFYDLELFEQALARVRRRVAEHNWQAFVRSTLEGDSAEETARALGLHVGMVYVARCKITRMLSDELQRLQASARK
jgi:RNA polymerase sigma factor (sigma-70 family)